jgi:hypothetical protein
MNPSSTRSMPAESPRKTDVIGDGGVPGPMPQQDAGDCHGHDMHPQKLVQLVGCHDPHAENLKK